MRVRDWMTPEPLFVHEETSIVDAYRLLMEYEIRHLPVLRDGKLVGIVSDRDIAKKLVATDTKHDSSEVIDEIMAREVLTIGPDDDLAKAAIRMHNEKVSALPVVQGNHQLIGILTTNDLLEALVWGLSSPEPRRSGDMSPLETLLSGDSQ